MKWAKYLLITFILLVIPQSFTSAASLLELSDIQSRQKTGVYSDHTILFVTPTGVASGEDIVLTFPASFSGVGSITSADVDLAEGNTGSCSTSVFTEKIMSDTPTSSEWSAVGALQSITISSGGAGATISSGRCVRIKIGQNATDTASGSLGPGVNQVLNGIVGTGSLTISGTFGDTGTIPGLIVLDDDQVSISATVVQDSSGGSGGGGLSGSYPIENLHAPTAITFLGTAYPYAHLYVLKDGNNFLNTTANNNKTFAMTYSGLEPGVYVFTVFVESFSGESFLIGTFTVDLKKGAVVVISGITIPDWVLDKIFDIEPKIPPLIPKNGECYSMVADINCDNKVNIVDMSIMLYWYRLKEYIGKVDLNSDKIINIGDFSVLAYYWTG